MAEAVSGNANSTAADKGVLASQLQLPLSARMPPISPGKTGTASVSCARIASLRPALLKPMDQATGKPATTGAVSSVLVTARSGAGVSGSESVSELSAGLSSSAIEGFSTPTV